MARREDLTGKKFNRLTALQFAFIEKGKTYWNCICDCGKEKIVRADFLKYGRTKSCSCLNHEPKNIKIVHGMSNTKLYGIWSGMKSRCKNPNDNKYRYYGSRGISVCDEWENFEPFLEWSIDNGYTKGLSIDRIDVNGNYEPSNCRWTTMKEQQNNKRNNVLLTYEGETRSIAQWANELGVRFGLLYGRLKKYDWNLELVISSLK